MKSLISFFTLLMVKALCAVFYRFDVRWADDNKVPWDRARLIVLLNHTSLFEVLYIGMLPVHFLRRLSKRLVVPIADKTLARPVIGHLFKIFSPGTMPVSRRRDSTWAQFQSAIKDESVVLIIPEGRMKRRTGFDKFGKKMTVKSGIADIFENIDDGVVAFAYSAGLHHVQAPGEGFPKLFKTLRVDVEILEIADYKAGFGLEIGSEEWRKAVVADCQNRLDTKVPKLEG